MSELREGFYTHHFLQGQKCKCAVSASSAQLQLYLLHLHSCSTLGSPCSVCQLLQYKNFPSSDCQRPPELLSQREKKKLQHEKKLRGFWNFFPVPFSFWWHRFAWLTIAATALQVCSFPLEGWRILSLERCRVMALWFKEWRTLSLERGRASFDRSRFAEALWYNRSWKHLLTFETLEIKFVDKIASDSRLIPHGQGFVKAKICIWFCCRALLVFVASNNTNRFWMLKAILESFITSCQYLICNTVCSGWPVRESSLPRVGDDIAVLLIIQVGIPIVLNDNACCKWHSWAWFALPDESNACFQLLMKPNNNHLNPIPEVISHMHPRHTANDWVGIHSQTINPHLYTCSKVWSQSHSLSLCLSFCCSCFLHFYEALSQLLKLVQRLNHILSATTTRKKERKQACLFTIHVFKP